MYLLNRLEKKFGKYAIHNLMLYIIFGNAIVFIVDFLYQNMFITNKLVLSPFHVLSGEVWRIFSFVFIPPSTSPIFILFSLYFYYLIGRVLENNWGTFKFNAYYFIGVLMIISASLISGIFLRYNLVMGPHYLNLSLFFAFARIYPDFQVRVFFVLPVKIKWLAWINWAIFFVTILVGSIDAKFAAFLGLSNYFLFFGKDIFSKRKNVAKSFVRKKEYTAKSKVTRIYYHQCEVCKKTEIDNPELEFRYCSKCDGYHEYCMEHLFEHEHIEE